MLQAGEARGSRCRGLRPHRRLKAERWLRVLGALLVAAVFTQTARAQELAWQFKKGDRFEYRTTLEQEQTVKGQGVAVSTRSKVVLTHRFEVLSVEDETGAATIRVSARRVTVEADAPTLGIKERYDSSRDRSAPASLAPFGAIKDGVFEMTVLPSGKVTDAGQLGQMMQDAASQVSFESMTVFGSMLAPGAARALLDSGFELLPAAPEEPGTWTEQHNLSLAGLGSVASGVTYHEVRSRRRGDRRFEFAGDFDFAPGGATPVTIKDGLFEGSFEFSERVGRLRDLQHEVKLEAEVSQGAPGGVAPGGGGATHVELRQQTRIELID